MRALDADISALGCLLAGSLIWIGWWYWNRSRSVPTGYLIGTAVAVGLLCRLAYVFITPIFYAPDEQAHFNYIQYLSVHHEFPVMKATLGEPGFEWEYIQSPLYYLILAPFFRVTESTFSNPEAMVRALRLFSVLLWLLNVWLGAILLRRLQIQDRFVRVFVMAMVCLLPTYTFISSTINNDNLLTTLSAGLLCLLARRQPTWKYSISLGLLLGLALLTKQSAAVFVPVIVFLLLYDCLHNRLKWSFGLLQLGIVLGLATLLYVPWMFRNWQVYHTFSPELLAAPHRTWSSPIYGMASAVHNLDKTFWAVSGISNNVGPPFPLVGTALLLLCCFSFVAPARSRPKCDPLIPKTTRPALGAFLLAVCLYVILTLRFGYLLGMGQGRHLFPVLYPIAIVLAARLRILPVKQPELSAIGFWAAYAISFAAFSLCEFPR